MMLVALYTSRVILNVLGIEDYGVYDVVGGVVVMFSLLTSSLSTAISRYITYELGRSDEQKLKTVFTTGFIILSALAVVFFLFAEGLGGWFLQNKLNIPEGREGAAMWVLQGSIIIFILNLLNVPYNASIIAHERMSAFAAISILEALLKFSVALLLPLSPFDKLKSYSVLLVVVALISRLAYMTYCRRYFRECRLSLRGNYDKVLTKDMFGFASWNLMGNGIALFNNQGINIITNLFFGVTVNAARGVTNQVQAAVLQFVTSFTTSLDPQITKSYASGDYGYLFSLVCKGAKFSFYLMLVLAIPILLETEFILGLWLKTSPSYAPIFVRLSILCTMADFLGNSTAKAVWATGQVKKYYLNTCIVSCFVFPITYLLFWKGYPPYISYVVFFLIYVILIPIRINVLGSLIAFPKYRYYTEVIFRILPVTIVSAIPPLCIHFFATWTGNVKSIAVISASVISTLVTICAIGLNSSERVYLMKILCRK